MQYLRELGFVVNGGSSGYVLGIGRLRTCSQLLLVVNIVKMIDLASKLCDVTRFMMSMMTVFDIRGLQI